MHEKPKSMQAIYADRAYSAHNSDATHYQSIPPTSQPDQGFGVSDTPQLTDAAEKHPDDQTNP